MKEIKGGTSDHLQSDPCPCMIQAVGNQLTDEGRAHGSSTGFCQKGRKNKKQEKPEHGIKT